MSIKRIAVGLICCVGSLCPIMAQTADAKELSLKESLTMGLEFNSDVRKAKMDIDAAAAQRKEITASGLPQISGYGNYNNFVNVFPQAIPGGLFGPDEGITVVGFGIPQSIQAGFQGSQLLFNQSYIVGLKAARTSTEFYDLLAAQTEDNVLMEIAQAHYIAYEMQLQLTTLDAQLERLQQLETTTKAQYENDLIQKLDYNRVTVNRTSLESQRRDLEIALSYQYNYLKLLIGMPLENQIEIQDENLSPDLLSTLAIDGLDNDLSLRADLRVLEKQQELNELNIDNIQSGYYPSLSLIADYNVNAYSEKFDFLTDAKRWHPGFLVGLRLSIPIIDSGTKRHQVSQARISQKKTAEDYTLATKAANMELQYATEKLASSIEMARVQESNMVLAEEVFTQTEMLYDEGLSPLTDLFNAESALREAKNQYHAQIIKARTARLEVLKSKGTIKSILN